MPTIDLRANRSSVFAHGTYDTGGGADHHLPVGTGSGLTMRGAFDFPAVSWAGVTEMVKAELELTTTDQVHIARGGDPEVECRRITAQWKPNDATDDGGGNWNDDPDAYPGPSTTTTGQKVIGGSTSAEVTGRWDVSAIVGAWAPATVKVPGGMGGGSKQYGMALREVSGTSHNAEYYSARFGTTSKRPRLIITTSTAPVPGKPTLQAPLGPSADGRTYRFAANMAVSSWDIDLATESTFAAPIWAPRAQAGGITGSSVAAPYAGPAYVAGNVYWWRARVSNANGTSPWSAGVSFTPDPNPSGRDPWEEWAQSILDAQSDPRLFLRLGTVRPTDAEVAALVTADMGATVRVDMSDAASPLRTEALLIGLSVSLDSKGWTLTPVLGALGSTATDWYGSSPRYTERVVGGMFAPVPHSYWPLGEPSGVLRDVVSNLNGTASGALTRGVAPLAGTDGALGWAGSGSVSYANIYSDPGAAFTILAWLTWVSGDLYVLDKVKARAGGGYTGWRAQVASDGALRLMIANPTTGALTTAVSPPVVRSREPALAGWVRDAAGMRLYVNGERVYTFGTPAPNPPGVDVTMPLVTQSVIAGTAVDELGFWRYYALSDDEMRDIWQG